MNPLVKGIDYTLIKGVLIINEGVKYIPDKSFSNRKDINHVFFPSTLIYIGRSAFNNCSLIGTVTIPDSVICINDYAFYKNEINILEFGKNVTYIGNKAYSYNSISEVINKSKMLRFIGFRSFAYNYKLSKFNFDHESIFFDNAIFLDTIFNEKFLTLSKLENNNCTIDTRDKYTFEDGVLKIHDGVQTIEGFEKLKGCTRVEMPDSILIIKSSCFDGLSELKSIKFSKNLLAIWSKALSNCGLDGEIVLPDSVFYIQSSAFECNSSLKKISVPLHISPEYIAYFPDKDKFEIRTELLKDEYNSKYIFDIGTLNEEERKTLEILNLLPETIRFNKKLNNSFNEKQANIIKDALVKYIENGGYDEAKNMFYVENQLIQKAVDISNMHDIVNVLFSKKQMDTIYLFIRYGYDYLNNSMISRVIMNNMNELIDVLLLLGADINEIGTIETTPLSTACIMGNYNIAKHLIEKGAVLNKTDKYNKSALDYAIENNHQDIVELINSYNNEMSEVESDLDAITRKLV